MTLATTVDTLLDRSIALGYGNVGLALRRRLPDWPADPPRMDGRVVLVTGAGAGIGLAAARAFAALGASVRAHGRSEQRAAEAARDIAAGIPGADVRPVAGDISRLAAMHAFVDHLKAEEPRLDVLVHNAGVMPPERTTTEDGVELTFATHVLAPFVLTTGLRPLLEASAPSRVILVSSGGAYGQQLPEDPESTSDEYRPKTFYARTKRQQLVLTEQLAEVLRGTGVVVHAMHPGWVDTGGVRAAMPAFRKATRPILRDAEQGADTIVWLGGAPEPLESTGRFWSDRRVRPTHYRAGAGEDPPERRAELWRHLEALAARGHERV